MKKNILAPSPQKYSWGWVPAHCIPFVVLREKKTKTLESNPFNIQRLWGLTLPQLFKKTGETKRGVFSDLGNFMSSTKFTLRSELFLVLKFYFKESLLSKKKSHRNPLTKITNYTTFPNPRVQRRNEALQFPHIVKNLDSWNGMLGSHIIPCFLLFFVLKMLLRVFWHRRNSCPFFWGGGFSASTCCQFFLA